MRRRSFEQLFFLLLFFLEITPKVLLRHQNSKITQVHLGKVSDTGKRDLILFACNVVSEI
jgi:hypothetical protein